MRGSQVSGGKCRRADVTGRRQSHRGGGGSAEGGRPNPVVGFYLFWHRSLPPSFRMA